MKNVIILITVLVVAIVAAYFYFRGSTQISTMVDTMMSEYQDLVATKPVIAGDFVTISKVVLTEPGFIMIHASNGGRTGAIIMTGDYLATGSHSNVIVKTGLTTKPGEKYFAMLHIDNGNQIYDNPGIDPPVIINGAIVQTEFSVVDGITASFEIEISGVKRDFNKAMYHNLSSDAYITTSNPNKVVVQKAGITWQNFFDTLPFSIDENCLTTGLGEEYCTGTNGTLSFFLNGENLFSALDKIISQGDKLEVNYE